MMQSQTQHAVVLDRSAFFQTAGRKVLPSLPHIHARLMEACTAETFDLKTVSNLLKKDPALTLQLLHMAGVAEEPNRPELPSVEKTLAHVGKDIVCDLIAFSAFETALGLHAKSTENLQVFWRHSMRCAVLAELLALEVQFHDPAGAFLAGMLHDIGRLALSVCFHDRYNLALTDLPGHPDTVESERTRMGIDHCRAGSWLILRYTGSSFMADAALYHHAPPEKIAEAFPLVQIVFVANLLSESDVSHLALGHVAAGSILGLDASQVEEIVAQAMVTVEETRIELGIKETPSGLPGDRQVSNTAVHLPLAEHLRSTALSSALSRRLLKAKDNSEIFQSAAQSIKLLFAIDNVYFFLHDTNRDELVGQFTKGHAHSTAIARLTIPMKLRDSLPVLALLQNKIADSFTRPDDVEPSLVETQLLHFSGAEGMLCLPLAANQKGLGTIVLGVGRNRFPGLKQQVRLLHMIARNVSAALLAHDARQEELKREQSAAMTAMKEKTRKAVHEVNNPLGVVRNYLRVLEMKLSRENIVLEEIEIIKEEMNRVARIVAALAGKNGAPPLRQTPVDLNATLLDITRLYKEALKQHGIELHLDLDSAIPAAMLDRDPLKQIFMNLIKNAVEALGDGGNIHLTTRLAKPLPRDKSDSGSRSTEECIRFVIEDDGPGIADDLRQSIFKAHVTSKSRHQGLGLPVVNDLVSRVNGSIQCESDQGKGTRFTIEFPVVQN